MRNKKNYKYYVYRVLNIRIKNEYVVWHKNYASTHVIGIFIVNKNCTISFCAFHCETYFYFFSVDIYDIVSFSLQIVCMYLHYINVLNKCWTVFLFYFLFASTYYCNTNQYNSKQKLYSLGPHTYNNRSMSIFLCKYENTISRQSSDGNVRRTMIFNAL